MTNDPLAAIAAVMHHVAVAAAVIGEHAVNVWLEARFTADVDVTVQASATDLAALQLRLAERGCALRVDTEPASRPVPTSSNLNRRTGCWRWRSKR